MAVEQQEGRVESALHSHGMNAGSCSLAKGEGVEGKDSSGLVCEFVAACLVATLVVTSATLVVTGALLVVTRS